MHACCGSAPRHAGPFNDVADAKTFLDQPNPALGNRIPRVMAATDAGARAVEAVLYRFVFGDYA